MLDINNLKTQIRLSTEVLKVKRSRTITSFSIKSLSSEGIGYKIKTNRPKDCIVDPGYGILMPDQEHKVCVKIINNDLNGKPEHRFKFDFCYFDWRKTVDELKLHIKNDKTPKLEMKMDIEFEEVERTQTVEKNDDLMEIVGYVYLAIIFFNIIKVMLQ